MDGWTDQQSSLSSCVHGLKIRTFGLATDTLKDQPAFIEKLRRTIARINTHVNAMLNYVFFSQSLVFKVFTDRPNHLTSPPLTSRHRSITEKK